MKRWRDAPATYRSRFADKFKTRSKTLMQMIPQESFVLSIVRICFFKFLLSCLLLCLGYAWVSNELCADEPLQFRQDVLPILSANCFACHGFDEAARQAGLRLDASEFAFEPADSGEQAIHPNQPDESELVRRVESDDPAEIMPPADSGKQLTDEQRRILRRWIAEGAKYQRHWSFEPPEMPTIPVLTDVEHPIDRFIQARLLEEKLLPSKRADANTLLRRVSLDLIGLPPSLEEIERYTTDFAANPEQAYQDLIDRLLSSPHYGERWGRWWLDQARYADSNGYSVDAPRQIWKYRDWVIDALDNDMTFDQFTIEQLAGDLLPNATQSQKVATGFHRNTQINQEGGIDPEQFRIDSVFDRVATTSTVWLGLTIGCCQCHDHKFEPIPQREYFQMFAFFNNQDEPTLKVYPEGVQGPEWEELLQRTQTQLADFIAAHQDEYQSWESSLSDAAIKSLPSNIQKLLELDATKRNSRQDRDLFAYDIGKADSDFQALNQQVEQLRSQINGLPTTLVMQERSTPRKTTVFIKGDFTRPAEEVVPGTPAILHEIPRASQQLNRLDLAKWIVSPENPLTARVIVNRVWQVYFGKGIVETENDFGSLGSPPSHPELLDYLALTLRANSWSLKSLHRLIVTSQTYQQDASERADLRSFDPENNLLGRQRRLRLDGEIVRDVSLAAAGLLSPKIGGPPVFPPIPEGVMGQGQVKRDWTVSTGEDRYRRGIYTFIYRATPPPSLNVFDAPDGFSSCTRRARSNTPLQALTLLNDSAFFEFALALERIIERDGIEVAFRRCTSRNPRADELEVLNQLDTQSAARVMLNLDETITRQ